MKVPKLLLRVSPVKRPVPCAANLPLQQLSHAVLGVIRSGSLARHYAPPARGPGATLHHLGIHLSLYRHSQLPSLRKLNPTYPDPSRPSPRTPLTLHKPYYYTSPPQHTLSHGHKTTPQRFKPLPLDSSSKFKKQRAGDSASTQQSPRDFYLGIGIAEHVLFLDRSESKPWNSATLSGIPPQWEHYAPALWLVCLNGMARCWVHCPMTARQGRVTVVCLWPRYLMGGSGEFRNSKWGLCFLGVPSQCSRADSFPMLVL